MRILLEIKYINWMLYRKKILLNGGIFLILCVISIECVAQDYSWWNSKHQWDGITPWYNYMKTTPAYMGPNALPVPVIKNGSLAAKSYVKVASEVHISKGDRTENLFTELNVVLCSQKVGLNIYVVPIEHFSMDTITRDKRIARDFDGEGYAAGDVYVGTYIQLLQSHRVWPDVLITIHLRTSSGNNLANARFTDTPGYYFDLSFGKQYYFFGNQSLHLKPFGMIGFYVWQMQANGQFQDDAFLYGLGAELKWPKYEVKNSLGGYVGYLNNGDQPMVYRLQMITKFDNWLNYELQVQQGLHDFLYTSVRLSCIFQFEHFTKKTSLQKDAAK